MSFDTLTVDQMWDAVVKGDKTSWMTPIEHILNKFGATLHCNRFAIGETIEKVTVGFLRPLGIDAEWLASAARYDIIIRNVTSLSGISCKFSSGDDKVTLNNARRMTTGKPVLHHTLLFLIDEWWFLDPPTIELLGVDTTPYLIDGRSSVDLDIKNLLPKLRELKYPYYFKQKIEYNKKKCQHNSTSDLFYEILKDHLDPDTNPVIKAYLQKKFDSLLCRRVTISDHLAPGTYTEETVDDLKERCRKRGIKGFSKEKKDDLVAMLKEHDEKKVAAASKNVVTVAPSS